MSTELLFYVLADGKEYRIYANGKTEGFGDNVKIVNHFPRLCSGLLQAVQDPEYQAADILVHSSLPVEPQSAMLRD